MSEALVPADVLLRMRSRREWQRWIDGLSAEVLDDLTHAPIETKRRLFKAHVRLVEIEAHAKCNRVCVFCPNAIMDRRRNEVLTDAGMLDRLFGQLGSIEYAGQIKVARYSEPLTNMPHLCERLRTARRMVPRAQLAIVTNTDYLSRDVLDALRESGLDVVYMSIYLRAAERWSRQLALHYNTTLRDKLGARLVAVRSTATSVRCVFEYQGLALRSACHNWSEYGTDRGGSVPQYAEEKRVGPCREPFETFVVDYNGSVMPCCALRSDLPDQASYVVGDLRAPGTSIFDIYAGRLAAWRRSMVSFGEKASPCTTCRHRDVPEDLAGPLSARLTGRLRLIGRAERIVPN